MTDFKQENTVKDYQNSERLKRQVKTGQKNEEKRHGRKQKEASKAFTASEKTLYSQTKQEHYQERTLGNLTSLNRRVRRQRDKEVEKRYADCRSSSEDLTADESRLQEGNTQRR